MYLDVASTIINADENPRRDIVLKNVKSMCHLVPKGGSVLSVSEPRGIFVAPAAMQIGQLPGSGANLHGSPRPFIIPLSTIC